MADGVQWTDVAQVYAQWAGVLVAALGLLAAFHQAWLAKLAARRAERWERKLFIADRFRHFLDRAETRIILKLLDWKGAQVVFPSATGEPLTAVVTDGDIVKALEPAYGSYDEVHARLRDCLDVFLEGLTEFEALAKDRVVEYDDFVPYFSYWARQIGKREPFRDGLRAYADYFYEGAPMHFIDGVHIAADESRAKRARQEGSSA